MALFDSFRKASPATLDIPSEAVPSRNSENPPRRALIVGQDAAWCEQVQRGIAPLKPNWKMNCATECAEALEAIASECFHIFILNARTPHATSLLKALEMELAESVCLVCCDTSDRTSSAPWRGSGATLVPEDADAATLVTHVKRTQRIREWMIDPSIKKLISQIRRLPAQPKLHLEVTEELQSPSASLDVVGKIISQDPIMTAKILQVVNSAFFGLGREISDTTEAVMVLGAERIKSLILLAGAFSQYAGAKCPGFSPEPVWAHSVQVGTFARTITWTVTKDAKLAEAAFTAGLMHDIGKLVIAGNLPDMYDTVQRLKAGKRITQRDAEMDILGTSHAELGGCLLATWGLPLAILEAIAWHHQPERAHEKEFSLLAAVHAANVFAQENNGDEGARSTINVQYLKDIGVGGSANAWREICGLEPKPEEETIEQKVRRLRESRS
jgi:HD-like signal output (HDOD) protein